MRRNNSAVGPTNMMVVGEGVDRPVVAELVVKGDSEHTRATSNSKRQLVSERLNVHSRWINRFVE